VMASSAETVTGPFTIVTGTDLCSGVTLNADGKCTVYVAFAPTIAGSQGGSLAFTDNAVSNPEQPQAVHLAGTGTLSTPVPTSAPGQSASATISPSRLSLGPVEVGNTSAPMSVKITSTSLTTALVISAVTITSAGGASVAAQFAETDDCTTGSLIDGQSCTVSVTFTPAAAGSVQASLVFNDNVPFNITNPQSVALSGTGSSPPASPSPAPTNSIL